MTEATAEVGSVLLHNSVNVMTRQREEIGEMSYPLFTHREIDRASKRWRWCPMRQRISLPANGQPNAKRHVNVRVLRCRTRARLDRSNAPRRRPNCFLHRGRQFRRSNNHAGGVFPEEKIDVLIMECTRGDHAKPEGWTRAGEEQRLAEALAPLSSVTRAC
jgi:Cft2 family RNA processing exonuclease